MNKIVVVGGGTAGWMSAIAIASRFPEKQIVVIDPIAMGPIGVGESVTGVVMLFVTDPLHRLPIGEFFRTCDVTFKAGIWYKNWQGIGTEYLSPIDSPREYFQYPYALCEEEFFAAMAASGQRMSKDLFYSHLMQLRRTDHYRRDDGGVNHAFGRVSCHFDAVKFANWLSQKARSWTNIEHIDDVIDGFQLNSETGWVESVRTHSGQEIAGDFFIDCTGFHRNLLAKAYQPAMVRYDRYVHVDSAIPCFQPFEPGKEIPNFTMATAMPHGWMWQIPTQSRLGRGYIFSSKYIDVPQAVAEMRAAGVDPGDDPRVLRFEPGRFDRAWINNVCTIGLSGGFIEPLEASTIHGMYVQLLLLHDLFLPTLSRESMPVFAQQYNQLVATAYEDYLDFINFHYFAGRSDTEFWREMQKPESMTPTNQFRREKWRHAFPVREDFLPFMTGRVAHLTGLVTWAPMLDALGYFRPDDARLVVAASQSRQLLDRNYSRYMKMRDAVVPATLSHSEAIDYFRTFT